MVVRTIAIAITLIPFLAPLRAQDDAPAGGTSVPPPVATLIAAANWSCQCDPIRFSLRVACESDDVVVRAKQGRADDALFPFEVERRVDDRWVPVRVVSSDALGHPARYVVQTNGRRLGRGSDVTVEVDLWHLDAVSVPGRIRVHFLLEAREAPKKDAAHADAASKGVATKDTAFTDLSTPWLEIDVCPHEGNAAHLLGSDSAGERAAYEQLMLALNSTWAMQRSRGPVDPGPTWPSLAHWQGHVPVAERLVADAKVSWRIHSRARLVLAHDASERGIRARGEVRDEALRVAREHLEANELVASPPSGGFEALPSGGFEPLRRMLLARIDGLKGTCDPRLVRRELRERYPFFATWWDAESAGLLGR